MDQERKKKSWQFTIEENDLMDLTNNIQFIKSSSELQSKVMHHILIDPSHNITHYMVVLLVWRDSSRTFIENEKSPTSQLNLSTTTIY